MSELGKVCHLARQCRVCELESERDRLKAELEESRKSTKHWREDRNIWESKAEKLADLLGDMVAQNLHQENGVYETGFIGLHKEVMEYLCEIGLMEMVKDGYHRGFWAKFKTKDALAAHEKGE